MLKAVHTGRKITYPHLRKFFEQMCNNVLMVHPGLRDYIMAHNTGSLDVQSYDGKFPTEIYQQYMEKWEKVNLMPKELNWRLLSETNINYDQSFSKLKANAANPNNPPITSSIIKPIPATITEKISLADKIKLMAKTVMPPYIPAR
ncbi:MAG TPA: hypothetical protein ENG51_13505 [Deltaproteobacteria bacterium]|nr:hypothetical protein [Deltaproteobacteria bacterium]